ncbi:MAG TPA: hypothetical protein VKB26_04500 [Candidatus Acidoferrales bacterium]|nr:hypothetical protein [Candidatus Acidoferrales bacterium]
MEILKRLAHIVSDRDEYQKAIHAIDEAICAGKLSPQEKRQKATEFIGPKGWRSHFEGIDWVELGLYAKEAKMPFETVADLLAVLRRIGKT